MTKAKWCLATHPTIKHREWGKGFTAALAESDARFHVKQWSMKKPETRGTLDEGWVFTPTPVLKSKFKVGQKIRRISWGSTPCSGKGAPVIYRVHAVPDRPDMNGYICNEMPNIAGIRFASWAHESDFAPYP